jgi:hypothetical protein
MDPKSDFFISYSGADRAWAEWIAWQLEANGYTTVLQAWDFIPGRDFGHLTQQAMDTAKRTIVVLFPAYVASMFGEAEWRPAFAEDPAGQLGLLVPVRVAEVTPPGLLATRIFIDLVGVTDEQEAIDRLLQGLSEQRVIPSQLDGGICDTCIELPMPVGPVEGKPRPWLPELELLPHFGVTTSAQVGRWRSVRSRPACSPSTPLSCARARSSTSGVGKCRAPAQYRRGGHRQHPLVGSGDRPLAGQPRPVLLRARVAPQRAAARGGRDGGVGRRPGRRRPPQPRCLGAFPWPGGRHDVRSRVCRGNQSLVLGQADELPARHRSRGGRWYPTLVTLPDGRVLAMSGHPEDPDTRHHTITIEAFSPTPAPRGDWSDEGDQLLVLDSYPRLHIIPGGAQGKLLCTTLNDGQSWTWDPQQGLGLARNRSRHRLRWLRTPAPQAAPPAAPATKRDGMVQRGLTPPGAGSACAQRSQL